MKNLTKDVMQLNQMRKEIKNLARSKRFIELEQSIMQRCITLAYQVPEQSHLLQAEQCAEFLLEFHPHIKNTIINFKDLSIPFEAYFRKIIRIRAKHFCAKRNIEQTKESLIVGCCDTEGMIIPSLTPCQSRETDTSVEGIDSTAPSLEDIQRWELYESYRKLRIPSNMVAERPPMYQYQPQDAPKLFRRLYAKPFCEESRNHIRSKAAHPMPSKELLESENPLVARLQNALRNPIHRKRLLTLLLSSSQELTPALINHVSSIMDIDELELAELIRLVTDASQHKRKRLEHLRSIAYKHWKRGIWLDQQLSVMKQGSVKDLKDLQRLEQERAWVKRILKERREEIRHCSQELSSADLAQFLEIPKGTVCSGMFYARKMLQDCLEEES